MKKVKGVSYSRKLHSSRLNPKRYGQNERELIARLLEGRKLPRDVAYSNPKIINTFIIDFMLCDGGQRE